MLNRGNIIPLQDLKNTLYEVNYFGLGNDCEFASTLAKYTVIYNERKKVFEPEIKNQDWFTASKSQNTKILAVNLHQYYSQSHFDDILGIAPSPDILVLFGNPGLFDGLHLPDDIKGLLYVHGLSGLHQSLAAQVIMGGVAIDNNLPYPIAGNFERGEGLSNGPKIRLGYLPPMWVGMDGKILDDSIRDISLSSIQNKAFPGCQVLVAKDGYVVYHKSFGYQTYDSIRPVLSTDIYDFASVTKITTGLAAVMKLHAEGDFDLEAPLASFFKEMKGSNKGQIPLRQILGHNARIKSWIAYWTTTKKPNGKFKAKTIKRDSSARYSIKLKDDMWLYNRYRQKQIYKQIKKSPLNPEPGYVYSGLLFYLLPEIIERKTGIEFEKYLKTHFYHQLGAYTLTYNPAKLFPLARIIPTERDTFFRMMQIHGVVHDEGAAMMDGVSGNAGLFGSANDLAKLAQMYTNYGHYGGTSYIAQSTLEEFTRCQYCDEDNRRGLGFDRPPIEHQNNLSHVCPSVSDQSFGHSGYTGTFVWMDPKYDLIYIFFSNRVYPTRLNRKLYHLNVRPRIQQTIYDSFLK